MPFDLEKLGWSDLVSTKEAKSLSSEAALAIRTSMEIDGKIKIVTSRDGHLPIILTRDNCRKLIIFSDSIARIWILSNDYHILDTNGSIKGMNKHLMLMQGTNVLCTCAYWGEEVNFLEMRSPRRFFSVVECDRPHTVTLILHRPKIPPLGLTAIKSFLSWSMTEDEVEFEPQSSARTKLTCGTLSEYLCLSDKQKRLAFFNLSGGNNEACQYAFAFIGGHLRFLWNEKNEETNTGAHTKITSICTRLNSPSISVMVLENMYNRHLFCRDKCLSSMAIRYEAIGDYCPSCKELDPDVIQIFEERKIYHAESIAERERMKRLAEQFVDFMSKQHGKDGSGPGKAKG